MDLATELASDTTIIEQPDRSPSIEALNRMLERLGIRFDPRLDSARECMVKGAQILSSPTISCRIRPGAEPLSLHIVADSGGYEELQVLKGTQVAQHIDLTDFERPDSAAPALYAQDLDGDGTREVIMQRYAGATGNYGSTVWRADPLAHRLTRDSAMSEMSGMIRMPGRPCILQTSNISARDHQSKIDCFLDGEWRTVWTSSTEWLRESHRIVRNLEVVIEDTLRLIRIDTVGDPDWRKYSGSP